MDLAVKDKSAATDGVEVRGRFVHYQGAEWYEISGYDHMPDFFMTITSPDEFWMFVSSSGGITCGRGNADNALFEYSTVDRVSRSQGHSGGYTRILVSGESGTEVWQPFDPAKPGRYRTLRRIRKSRLGDRLMFEEENPDLGLVFWTVWETSPLLGIHRRCGLRATGASAVRATVVDGIRGILPGGTTAQTQGSFSNLLHAYKRSEASGELGIFTLSATMTDRAEPSESLRATTVWSWGLEEAALLLSDRQIESASSGGPIENEVDVKGEPASYLRRAALKLEPGKEAEWGFCAELRQDHASVVDLIDRLEGNKTALVAELRRDIVQSSLLLEEIVAKNDGIQDVGSVESGVHHSANVLFNIMRGGYFISGYEIVGADFADFVRSWNAPAAREHQEWLAGLPTSLSVRELQEKCGALGDPDLVRLAYEYLPLTFSRRHGDPSRPWNVFSIRTRDEAGRQIIGYQGNWRDIFQNWEALCLSHPRFFPSVIAKFLNATTADGYNPYRISQDGFNWEEPNPEDPWANIGYWSDHQIVYLTKLLEHCAEFYPDELHRLGGGRNFVFAHVPYEIAEFPKLVENPYDSIRFLPELSARLKKQASEIGADGHLLRDASGQLVRASLAEKVLILFLAKLANYVPGGGIWMNTQRPEWNDANNALAGWGLSMVTLAYLYRFIPSLRRILGDQDHIELRPSLARWVDESLSAMLTPVHPDDSSGRLSMLEKLGRAATVYRDNLYGAANCPEGQKVSTGKRPGPGPGDYLAYDTKNIRTLLDACSASFAATIRNSMREDGTYESYQVLEIVGTEARIRRLYPMLEGQVAGLSTDILSPSENLEVLAALRSGPLYREDQHSYMLYPNRDIPGFLKKNQVDELAARTLAAQVAGSEAEEQFSRILAADKNGGWHFCADFRNAGDLRAAAEGLPAALSAALGDLFERTFNHREFTGRSGTFFAYEGLGSIYWHMVSKLLLAVQEQLLRAYDRASPPQVCKKLAAAYQEIRNGLSFNKSPREYGAFPCDPYSHTPWGKGAQQPGMTGQVKEEILARFAELGLTVSAGRIRFRGELVLEDQWKADGTLSYAFCGTRIVLRKGGSRGLWVILNDGGREVFEELELPRELSQAVFDRSSRIAEVEVRLG